MIQLQFRYKKRVRLTRCWLSFELASLLFFGYPVLVVLGIIKKYEMQCKQLVTSGFTSA